MDSINHKLEQARTDATHALTALCEAIASRAIKRRTHRKPTDKQLIAKVEELIDSGGMEMFLDIELTRYIGKGRPWSQNELARGCLYIEKYCYRLCDAIDRPSRRRKNKNASIGLIRRQMVKPDVNAKKRKIKKRRLDRLMLAYAEGLMARHVENQLIDEECYVPFDDLHSWLHYKKIDARETQRSPRDTTRKIIQHFEVEISEAALKKRLSRAKRRFFEQT